MSGASAFVRLDPTIQEALYRLEWKDLRPMQMKAIHAVLDSPHDIILSARTASGKTEAAFLPVLSQLVADPQPGVGAVYVGPLKALINDQFMRLEVLCQAAEIPVHKWHGDVSAGPKKRLLNQPSGVLLITPESIESLFVNHPQKLGTVFGRLRFVVIDELHSFIGTERGAHLRSLLTRLSSRSAHPVRYLGLSATLGSEIGRACQWLRHSAPESVIVIHGDDKKSIQVSLQGYLEKRNPLVPVREDDDNRPLDHGSLEGDLFAKFHGKTALIFANSKTTIEHLADQVSREAKRCGLPDNFRVHHGSLSKGEREDTEAALKSNAPTATFCSSTLEMGIDVGNVEQVGQVGAPWSVSSLAQRLGRSGRRDGQASVLRMFVVEDEPEQDTPLEDRLFPDLLQAAATVELLCEKWCEPPESNKLHLSTLVQQILSVITERGGARADELYKTLVASGAFPAVSERQFIATLRSMGAHDLVEQTPIGLLITGLKGEKIVRSHDFYVVFIVTEEYRVNHGGHHIGSIPMDAGIQENGYLILAGRRWKVLDIDTERKVISVQPSSGGRRPDFVGKPGGEIHPRIRQRMRELLAGVEVPSYLDHQAKLMLVQSRKTAQEAGLLENPFVQDAKEVLWFTWTGTRIHRTLEILGRHFGELDVEDRGILLVFKKSTIAEIQAVYRTFLEVCPTVMELALKSPNRFGEKYESFLSDEQTAEVFSREYLDINGALKVIRASCLA